jgi:hypothetical protein
VTERQTLDQAIVMLSEAKHLVLGFLVLPSKNDNGNTPAYENHSLKLNQKCKLCGWSLRVSGLGGNF